MSISIGGTKLQLRNVGITTQQSIPIIGFNSDINTATVPEDIWAGPNPLVVIPGSEGIVSVVSDDANDTSAGTGAQSVVLDGVDDSFDPVLEVISMNGTTPVLSIANFRFINLITVIASGSGGGNAGLITFTIGGGIVNAIAIGKNLSSTAVRMMPNALVPGTRPHITRFQFFVGKQQTAQVSFSLFFDSISLGHVVEGFNIPATSTGGPTGIEFDIPIAVQIGDTIGGRVIESSANGVLVAASAQVVYLQPFT